MFVCLGAGSDDLWFSDLHRLSLDSLEWKEVEVKGQAPSPRDYSSLVSVGERVCNDIAVLYTYIRMCMCLFKWPPLGLREVSLLERCPFFTIIIIMVFC